jgi:tetratricopeptide (TPR) repeat protein
VSFKTIAPDGMPRPVNINPGRNDPCPCGSEKKYKKCCGREAQTARPVPSFPTGLAPPQRPLPSAELQRLAALVKQGRYSELEPITRGLLAGYPNSGLVWKLLGLSLWMQGKDAVAALESAAELLPGDPEAHGNLGNALRAAGQLERAAQSHGRALALDPHYAEAHNDLGSVQQDLGRLDAAMASFRRAVEIKPGFALAHANLGNVLMLQNRRDEAEASCRRALAIAPRMTAAIVQLAELHADSGRFSEAEGFFRSAITIEPDMPEAWAALVRFRKMERCDSAWLSEVLRILSQRLAPRREVHLRYALGKYFDDVGEYTEAFAHYRRANELTKFHGSTERLLQLERGIELVIRSQTRDWLDSARAVAAPGDGPDQPVFIVGMPRSGTTLAEQILASHPEVFGAGELHFWNGAAAGLANARARGEPDRNALSAMAGEYRSLLTRLAPGARRVVDKMPANFLHLGMIHAALPNARIIHMRRNPLDTCLSVYFQNFGAEHFYASDLDDLAGYYAEYVRIMAHWRRTLPPHTMLEVPYEALVEAPEDWSRRMLDFIGLSWDPRCLEFHRSSRTISTHSKWQARQKISASSIGRWRNYEKFLGPLMPLAGGREAAAARFSGET